MDYAPPWLAVAMGSRTAPAFNLSRRRVAGELLEIGVDDLRFRSWEVEQLFRDFYGEALRPDELARLARGTEGWAAGLQLFHLATRGKTAEERRRVLAAPGTSGRLLREYLARNVVAELPADLRDLPRRDVRPAPTVGPPVRCAQGKRAGSRALLEDLERRNVFTVALDDEGTFRYHEVLRSHLEGLLVEEIGESGRPSADRDGPARSWRRMGPWPRRSPPTPGPRTGPRSIACCTSAASSSPPTRRRGSTPCRPALLVADPWLTLATARRHRAEGRWAAAVDAYARAEALFGAADTAVTCRRERLALAIWLDPLPAPGQDWSGALRSAVVREPLLRRDGYGAGGRLRGPGDALAAGLGALMGGRVAEARRVLMDAAEDPAASPATRRGCGSRRRRGRPARRRSPGQSSELEAALAAAERQGAGWLARVGRVALALAGPSGGAEYGPEDAAAAAAAAAREEDRWGEAIATLAEGWGRLADERHRPHAARDRRDALPGPGRRDPGGLGPGTGGPRPCADRVRLRAGTPGSPPRRWPARPWRRGRACSPISPSRAPTRLTGESTWPW